MPGDNTEIKELKQISTLNRAPFCAQLTSTEGRACSSASVTTQKYSKTKQVEGKTAWN